MVEPEVPRWVEVDDYLLRGTVFRRLRIILRANGCSRPTCTMCPFPNEGADASAPVTGVAMIKQVSSTLERYSGVEMVCIYNDGSFFSEAEMPGEVGEEICSLVAASGARRMMVESLPQLVTPSKVARVLAVLGPVQLVVGFGLQSVSDLVREVCVNSPVSIDGFLAGHRVLSDAGQETKAYLMLKPPFLTESEAIEDTAMSVAWLRDQGVSDVAICPTRVVEGTLAARLFAAGLFTPPRLTTVAETLRRAGEFGCTPRVSLFNLDSSDLQSTPPSGCVDCSTRLLSGIRQYNVDPASVDLGSLNCGVCERAIAIEAMQPFNELPIRERVSLLLEREAESHESGARSF